MPTLADIKIAYANAQRSGNVEDAQAIAQILQRASQPQAPKESTREKLLRQYEEAGQRSQPIQSAEDPGMFTNLTRGIGAGFVGTGEVAALGAASLLEEEEELAARKKIQDFASAVRPERGDPDSALYKLGSGLGSIAGFAAPAAALAFAPVSAPVAGGLGLASAAGLGVAATAGEASERARAAGATEEERNRAIARIAPAGVLEALPLGRLFGSVPRLGKLFSEGDEEFKGLVARLRSMAKTGGLEGAQEAAMGIAQNLNERGYNVERELVDTGVLEEGAIGAGSGAILQGIIDAFTKGKSRSAPKTREDEAPATEEELQEEQQLLGLPAPDPDKLVEVRMPDGSVQEVRQSDIEVARRREQEAVRAEERRRAELDTQMDALQRVEREDAQQRERERGVDLPEAEVRAAEEQRARARAQDEQIDAFTLEREVESAQPRREAPKPEPTEQMDLPIERAERDQVQREMFGPRGGIPRRAKEESKPEPRRAEQQLSLDLPQEQQALIGPKGGIPRRRKEPFKKPVSEPQLQEPTPQADVLTKERLDTLGIASSMQSVFVNKDVNKPETQRRLRNFARNKKGSKQARANVTRLLDGVSERQTDLFSETGPRTVAAGVSGAVVGKVKQDPSGDSVSNIISNVGEGAGLLTPESGAKITDTPENGRVDDTGGRVGESVRGAVAELSALSELDQQLLSRLEDKTKPLTKEEENTIGGQLTLRVNAGEEVSPKLTGLFVERVRGREQEIAKQKDAKQTKITTGTEPGKKVTTDKQVTRKAKTPAAPAEKKKEVKARTKLSDDPEVRARLDTLKKDLKDETTFKRYASPNTNTIPDDADPTTDNDNKIVANKLKVGTQKNREDVAVEAYLGRRERVIDGLDAAIYDLVVKTETDRVQEGRSEADKKFFASTSATVDGKSPDGKSPAGRVVAWAEKNLSKETQQWMQERRKQLEMQDVRLTAKRSGEDAVVKQRKADEAKVSATTQRTRARAELETYAQDDPFMTPAERRRAKRLMAAIDEFNDDMPYELRTGDTVLGMEIHPAAVAALRDGDIAGALRIVAASPNKDVARFASAFAQNIGDTKVKFFSSTAEDSLAGSFDPKTNTINLNTANGISQHTLLHEVGHALTSATLAKPSHPLTKQLTTLYNDVKDTLGTAYGAKNLDEFVSEAESNPEFRAELAGINPDGSDINALQRFLNSVGNFLRRLVGMKTKDIESAQTRADSLINEILAPAPEYRDAETLAMSSTAAGVKKVMSAMGSVQKGINKNNPLTEKGRKEFGELAEDTMYSLGSKAGFVVPKVLDLVALTDAINMVSKPLGAISQKFLVAVEEMRGAVAARDEATRKIIQPMEKWFDNTTPEQVKRFNDIIYSREYGSTIFQVDPKLSVSEARKKYQGKSDKSSNDLWAIWQKNHEQWKKLDPEGRRIYENMEKFYRDQHKALKDVLFARIDDTMGKTQEAKNLKDEITKRLIDKADLAVYFPLIREGRYKVGYRYKDGKTPKGQDSYVFEMYQSRSEWLARIEDIESNPDMEVTKSGEGDLDLGYAQKAPPTSFVNQTLKLLEGSGVDAKTQEAFMRMVIESLPETSFAKSLQPRENIAGHETDALRAIKIKGFSLGQQIERLGFNAKVQQLEAEVGEVSNPLPPKKQYIFEELQKDLLARMNFSTSGAKFKEFEGVVRVANQTAFLFTIGLNTASAMVNTSQIPLFVLPMLGGEHGYRASASAISAAASLVTGARHQAPKKGGDKGLRDRVQEALDASSPAYGLDAYYTEVNGNYTVRTDMDLPAERIKELKEIAPLVQRAAKRGHLNRSYMMDVLGLIEGGKARPNESLARKGLSALDRGTAISAMMFNQAERFNRQVAMVASYKLAIKKLETEQPNLTKAQREDLAIETAFKQTHEFNGGSTLETAPRIAQENIGRVAMMYKSYGLRMYATMIKTAKQALDVYKAELKENGFSDAVAATMTSTAGKQLLGIHGTAVFFAGVHGVPLYGAVQLFADTFLLGDEDDDFNTIVRNKLDEGWYKGAVNQLTGVDVASRIRLTGLVLQTNRYNTDASMEETIGFYLGGPAWSVGKRLLRGKDDILKGEFQRGVENLLPVGVANAYKVLGRYQQDGGVYSRRGDPIYDDITGGELAAQFFGFAPAEYTRRQENNQRVKRIDTTLSRKASALRKKYYLATRQGDFPEAREVMREIAKYNRAHPNFAITQESIDRSMKQHMKTSAEMYNGVTLSPAMRRLLNDQLEAERNGFVAPE